MSQCYDVWLGKDPVGKVYVDSQGLYFRFRCRCRIVGNVICRLVASRGGEEVHLGIPVPSGGEFALDTRLPAKRFPPGEFRFCLRPKHSELQGKFVPLSPQEPFAYITRLKNAYLEKRDGQVGLVITD